MKKEHDQEGMKKNYHLEGMLKYCHLEGIKNNYQKVLKVILRLFFLRSISTPFLLDLNIWVYLFIACRIYVLLIF